MDPEKRVINIVWADLSNASDMENLRKQVESSLSNPEYTIVSNYEIHWKRVKLGEGEVPRIVWAPNATAEDIEGLREQVEMALADPSFPIVCGFEVNVPDIEIIEKTIYPSKSHGLNRFQILKQKD